ncbi:MAG: methionyl-tRNA formyltransferase [Firmicutes bacterium]|nr:methionyl-tRNA formyltransferase [Bacillota bacterium]
MRIVFMGSAEFAVPALNALNPRHSILGVFTQPDRPRGRGRQPAPTPVKELALQLGLPVYQPERVKEPTAISWLQEAAPEAIVVVAYGQILPPAILAVPAKGCINLHGSLLPSYRGAAPVQWAVIHGQKETGVTTMFMDEGLDTGDILLQRRVPLTGEMTSGELYSWLAREGAELLVETLEKLETGVLTRLPQDPSRASYAPPLKREHERIDWRLPAAEIHNLVRGLNPQPGAYTTINGKTLKIWRTGRDPAGEPDGSRLQVPGEIVGEINREELLVQTGSGRLLLREVQPVGKNRMSAGAFARGYRIGPGVVMGED